MNGPLRARSLGSGGVLVDCNAHLVGINTAGASVTVESGGGSIGLGFAIPVDLATEIVRTLKLPAGGEIHTTYERLGAGHTTSLTLAAEEP